MNIDNRGSDLALESRGELPALLNRPNLCGSGAEVGLQLAEFSEHILDHQCGEVLYSIDPWQATGPEYVDVANRPQDEQDAFYQAAIERLARFQERSRVLRITSLDAARQFAPGTLDFVYIDARHDEPWISDDIRA